VSSASSIVLPQFAQLTSAVKLSTLFSCTLDSQGLDDPLTPQQTLLLPSNGPHAR
jgi:hypothetical protein